MRRVLRSFLNPLGIKRGIEKNFQRLIHPRQTWKHLRQLTFRQWLRLLGRGLVGFLIFLTILFIWFSKDLPAISKLKALKAAESTQILDRNGSLLYAISGEKQRMIISGDKIPETAKQATIAIEDDQFYRHHGFDVKGVFRAVYYNLTRRHISQGGSTITQQYVKNALLSPKRTFSRKIKELILSLELEIIYSKDKILELYLNEIPYGSNAYGIEAASRKYFGQPAAELNLEESALLAALPQAPTYYSPYGSHKDKLMIRKDKVLDKMVAMKYITPEQAEEAKKKEIKFVPPSESLVAPHFVFYIREQLAEKYGEKMVEEGGLKVTTTLDLETQKKALEAVEAGATVRQRYGANNSALVAVEPATGQILAMVGSADYFNDSIDGQVNITTSARQPGSSFKPIVYATAFKEKYNPAFVLYDLKTDFGNYSPDNYDGHTRGPVTMRFALANSLNIPAVKTLALAGLKESLKTAEDLGITTLTEPDRYGLSLVLGGGEVKPLEMAGAFAVFANNGQKAAVTGILKVEDRNGRVLEEFQEDTQDALDPQIAFQINSILSDNATRSAVFGFTNNLTIPGRPVAVKTGTTQEFHDAWTIGYTPQISVAVWTGNADNAKMRAGADGSVVAAPIWNHFMKNFLQGLENKDFDRPKNVRSIEVDKMSNKLPTNDSPEKISDYFASWQVPTKEDDIHVRVKVNKLNGKIASEFTPESLIEERLFGQIHSEMPEKPAWEGPVQAWARANGYDKAAPQEKDDMYTSAEQLPVLEISSPTEGQSIQDTVTFSVSAQARHGVNEIKFAIDGVEIGSDNTSPYEIIYDVSNLSVGKHTLVAFAYDHNGASSSKERTFNVIKDSAGPEITNISITSTATTSIVAFSTNEPAIGSVKYGLSAASLNSQSTAENEPYVSHSISLVNLASNTLHYFQIVTRDQLGNTTTTPNYSFRTK